MMIAEQVIFNNFRIDRGYWVKEISVFMLCFWSSLKGVILEVLDRVSANRYSGSPRFTNQKSAFDFFFGFFLP